VACRVTKIGSGRVAVVTPEQIEIVFCLDPKTKKPLILSKTNYGEGEDMWVSPRNFSEALRVVAGIFHDPSRAEALRNP